MNSCCIVIPAVKKNVAFTDDLVKKLAGISLIQRAIDKARSLVLAEHIYVVTDSEEIRLISTRNQIRCYYDKKLKLKEAELFVNLKFFVLKIAKKYRNIILLSPYAPLLPANDLKRAYQDFNSKGTDFLQPVMRESHRLFERTNHRSLSQLVFGNPSNEIYVESQAFQILKSRLVLDNPAAIRVKPVSYVLDRNFREIRSYQDWWVCEKILTRKRIVFRVIGNTEIGMGHIFRSLALAHEISDHEVRFVCDHESSLAANKLAGYDYWLETYQREEIEEKIIELQPDLVINDVLNTSEDYIKRLIAKNIVVVNFEDLGSGAPYANLTINELYEDPILEGENILWGHRYFFVRDEFVGSRPHTSKEQVRALLITFGGTDYSDLASITYKAVYKFCQEQGVKIYIVTGEGYGKKEELHNEIKKSGFADVEFIHSTGVMSAIMEKTQIAITSNGRTIYELAHMNIPAIVVPHHAREKTHLFADHSKGFVNLGLYEGEETDKKILAELKRLVLDHEYRRRLFDNIKPYRFAANKKKVVKMIMDMLDIDKNVQ